MKEKPTEELGKLKRGASSHEWKIEKPIETSFVIENKEISHVWMQIEVRVTCIYVEGQKVVSFFCFQHKVGNVSILIQTLGQYRL